MKESPSSSHAELVPADRATAPGTPGRLRFRLGMIAKSTATMLIVGLVPLALFGAITLRQQGVRIRDEANQTRQSSGEGIASQVDEWADKNVRVLQAAASLPAITGMQREDQSKVLSGIQKAYPWMYLVFTIAPNGANVA